ncbi:MAG TPA: hypothetical protein VMF55_06965 [Solirubrobacterales bacterium]|nr:hypothetical protein [Solirubrobacterales bacterium]
MASGLAALLLLVGTAAAAQRGELDPTFGSGGQLTLEDGFPNAQINGMAVQPDGKTLLVGSTEGYVETSDFLLIRLDADGSLDPTFGSGGVVTTDFAHFQDGAGAAAIAPDGKIVVAGYASYGKDNGERELAVARYEADGTLDPTFSGDGKQTVSFAAEPGEGGSEGAQSVAIQPDGKVVIGGSANPSGTEIDFGIARFDANGELDPTFSGDGRQMTEFTSGGAAIRKLAIGPEGKIVALGYSVQAGGIYEFALARYDADGELDDSFSGDGKTTAEFRAGGTSEPWGLALQPDGKILAGGFAGVEFDGYEFVLARFDADGELDPSYGDAGVAKAQFVPSVGVALPPEAFAMAGLSLAPDGTAFLAGSFRFFEEELFVMHEEMAVAAFRPDGTLDPGFSGDGLATFAFGGTASAVVSALDPQGRLLLAGFVAEEPSSRFVVSRLFGLEPPLPPVTPVTPPATAPGTAPASEPVAPPVVTPVSVACRRATTGLRLADRRVGVTGARLAAARKRLARADGRRQKAAARRALRRARIRFEGSKDNRDRASRKAAARC